MTPLFLGGGRSRPFHFPASEACPERFTVDNHSEMREIEESGFAAFLVLTMPYPPSERAAIFIGHCGIKKQPILRLSQPALISIRKPHGPPCRIVVNRDPFRDLGFGLSEENMGK